MFPQSSDRPANRSAAGSMRTLGPSAGCAPPERSCVETLADARAASSSAEPEPGRPSVSVCGRVPAADASPPGSGSATGDSARTTTRNHARRLETRSAFVTGMCKEIVMKQCTSDSRRDGNGFSVSHPMPRCSTGSQPEPLLDAVRPNLFFDESAHAPPPFRSNDLRAAVIQSWSSSSVPTTSIKAREAVW